MEKSSNKWKSAQERNIYPLQKVYISHYQAKTIRQVRKDPLDNTWWEKYGVLTEPMSEFGVIYLTWLQMESVASRLHSLEFISMGITDGPEQFDKWDEMD